MEYTVIVKIKNRSKEENNMTNVEMKSVERIRAQYTGRERTKLDELKELDKRAKRPATVFAYTFGTIGTLILGLGMCLAMKVIGDLMVLGILIGLVGIALVSVNYFIYKKLLKSRKDKYSSRIFALSDELLNKA